MPTQFPPELFVQEGSRGRGVFTRHDIQRDFVVCRDPVVVIDFDAVREDSILNDYPMRWTETENAMAFGLSNLMNHFDDPNCEAMPDLARNEMKIVTLRTVRAGEELTIRYACPIWFKTKGENAPSP